MIRIRVQEGEDVELSFWTGERLWVPTHYADRTLHLEMHATPERNVRWMPVLGGDDPRRGTVLLVEVFTPWK